MSELPRGNNPRSLYVGANASVITPRRPTFLYGYPHAPRTSTGVHDPLLASALFIRDGCHGVLFVSVDTIWLSKRLVADARARIAAETGLPLHHLMITATHTHSGPMTVRMLSNAEDSVVPPPDPDYLRLLVDGIVNAAVCAYQRAEPAEMAFTSAECPGIGGNRHDPLGPTITTIPIIAARAVAYPNRWLGMMYVNRVHPTVLHEDSTLVSADFPGMCRTFLQTHVLGQDCPVLCHLGAAGNQSPRYVVRSHDFAEAERIGDLLGGAIEDALATASFSADWRVSGESIEVELPARRMPSLEESIQLLQLSKKRLEDLRAARAEYGLVRTAECAVFGAEETMCLARAATEGTLRSVLECCLPAEVQLIRLGEWSFVGWPGEVFAEFALTVRNQYPEAFICTLANGELQGYLVTKEAVEQNAYEASNAVLSSPEAGEILVWETLSLLARAAKKSEAKTSPVQAIANP